MSNDEELLKLTRENNFMLKQIVKYLSRNNSDAFLLNVLADMVVDTARGNGK